MTLRVTVKHVAAYPVPDGERGAVYPVRDWERRIGVRRFTPCRTGVRRFGLVKVE